MVTASYLALLLHTWSHQILSPSYNQMQHRLFLPGYPSWGGTLRPSPKPSPCHLLSSYSPSHFLSILSSKKASLPCSTGLCSHSGVGWSPPSCWFCWMTTAWGWSGFPTSLHSRRRKGFGKTGGVGNDNDSGPLAGSFELRNKNKSQLGFN